MSHGWSNSSLLEVGPSSAAEERVSVVSKQGCYIFSKNDSTYVCVV